MAKITIIKYQTDAKTDHIKLVNKKGKEKYPGIKDKLAQITKKYQNFIA